MSSFQPCSALHSFPDSIHRELLCIVEIANSKQSMTCKRFSIYTSAFCATSAYRRGFQNNSIPVGFAVGFAIRVAGSQTLPNSERNYSDIWDAHEDVDLPCRAVEDDG